MRNAVLFLLCLLSLTSKGQRENEIVLSAIQDAKALIAQKQYKNAKSRLEDMKVFDLYNDSIEFYIQLIEKEFFVYEEECKRYITELNIDSARILIDFVTREFSNHDVLELSNKINELWEYKRNISNRIKKIITKMGVLGIDFCSGFNGIGIVGCKEKYGVINDNGDLLVPIQYDDIAIFADSIIFVNQASKWSLISLEGKMIFSLSMGDKPLFHKYIRGFKYLGIFENAFFNKYGVGIITDSAEHSYALIDKKGNYLTNHLADIEFESDSLYPIVANNGKIGYVDNKGKQVFPCAFNAASAFCGGVAIVQMEKGFGIINTDFESVGSFFGNKPIIRGQTPFLRGFHDGLAPVENDKGMCGFVDKTGNLKISCQYKYVGDFSEGLATVSRNTLGFGESGLINKNDSIVIPLGTYYSIGKFKNGVSEIKKDNKYGHIDKKGNLIAPLVFDNHLFFPSVGGTYFEYNYFRGVVHIKKSNGEIIKTLVGLRAKSFYNGFSPVDKEKKFYGFIDAFGELYPIEN